jgi:septum site-determining protein MinD
VRNITTITSAKGGVGKSTLAVVLGGMLARNSNKKILLVDANAGLRSLNFLLDLDGEIKFDASDVIKGKCQPKEAILSSKKYKNLFLLIAPLEFEFALSSSVFIQLMFLFSKNFDYIFIDCPFNVGKIFESVIATSNKLIAVTTTEPESVSNTKKIRQRLLKIKPEIITRLVINKFSRERFLRFKFFDDLDQVVDATGFQLMGIIPQDELIFFGMTKGLGFPSLGLPFEALKKMSARFETLV